MTDMTSMPYLRLTKNGTYQYRRAVPPDIRARLGGKTEIVVSLRTRDVSVAKRQIKSIADGVDKQFSDARKGRNVDTDVLQALSIVGWWLDAINDELQRETMDDGHDNETPEPPFHNPEELRASLDRYLEYLSRNNHTVCSSVFSHIRRLAPIEYYRDRAIRDLVPDYTGSFEELGPSDQIDLSEYRFGRGLLPESRPAPTTPSPAPPPVKDESRTPLSEVLEAFTRKRDLTARTEHEWRLAWQRLIEYVGDIAVGDLRRGHLIQWLDLLQRMPVRMSVRERRLPLPALIERFEGKNYETVSAATVDKYRSAIRGVLIWSEGRFIEQSPARGLRPDTPQKKRPGKPRLPFTVPDMNVIFSTPVYRGCMSEKSRWKPGRIIIQDADYWLPLLAAFTGARLEELGQLLTADIHRLDRIDFIDITTINDEKKRLKTQASVRQVPIHSTLIDIGFLKYVDQTRRAGHEMLFPHLKRDVRGSVTQAFSRRWNRWLRRYGITDERKVFHSFRHAFKDAARLGGIPKQERDRLQGHTVEDEAENYGIGWPLRALKREIEKIKYPGLKLPEAASRRKS